MINLSKGEKIDLTKGRAGLTRIRIGTNWDPAGTPPRKNVAAMGPTQTKKRGFLATLGAALQGEARIGDVVNTAVDRTRDAVNDLTGRNEQYSAPAPYSGANIDIDTSVVIFQNDKYQGNDDLVYFGHKSYMGGAIQHMGDNLTGADNGDEDDETIIVNLDKIPANKNRLVVISNIYGAQSRHQHFGMIGNAYVTLYDDKTGEVLANYDLTDNYDSCTAIIIGELYRHNGEWKFGAIGDGSKAGDITTVIQELRRRYE